LSELSLLLRSSTIAQAIASPFLFEAVVLCFCGGFVGILIGRGISYLIRVVLNWPTELSLEAIVAAFAVSVMVAILFGFYPAWKASRLDPIVALRYG
jgi:ABC-type antimicrobial peptide transport system permease subunit